MLTKSIIYLREKREKREREKRSISEPAVGRCVSARAVAGTFVSSIKLLFFASSSPSLTARLI